MNNSQLQALTCKISCKYFARPFLSQIYFDSRLRSTGGRYHLRSHKIDINPRMLNDFSKTNLIRIIKHELCHYHLCCAGYSGRHNTKRFQRLLISVGGSRYAPQPKMIHWLKYQCRNCGRVYQRRRRLNVSRYVCGRCGGQLTLVKIRSDKSGEINR